MAFVSIVNDRSSGASITRKDVLLPTRNVRDTASDIHASRPLENKL